MAGAAVIPPVLNLLARAYGFAGAANVGVVTANPLPAPQATLISALAQGVIGGNLDWKMIGIGVLVGLGVIALDEALGAAKRMRIPPLAVGIGIYLPMSATFAVVVGAVVGHWYNKRAARTRAPGARGAARRTGRVRHDRRREPLRRAQRRAHRRAVERRAARARAGRFRGGEIFGRRDVRRRWSSCCIDGCSAAGQRRRRVVVVVDSSRLGRSTINYQPLTDQPLNYAARRTRRTASARPVPRRRIDAGSGTELLARDVKPEMLLNPVAPINVAAPVPAFSE